MGSIWCSGGVELGRYFSYEGGFRKILSTPKYIIGFRSSTFDVGQNSSGGSKVDRC
jgi:hypothetical protein